MSMDDLAKELERLGYSVNLGFRQNGVLVIDEFRIEAGAYAGKVVDIGIPSQDFPFTLPAGIHVHPMLAPIGQNGISQSPLGNDWQYWSRRLADWGGGRTARHVISYVNKVFI